MTTEKAIDLLDNLLGMVSDNQDNDYNEAIKMGKKALNQQAKYGEWLEIEVSEIDDFELQSAKCSYCGLYHTTPYMYYVTHYPYCPSCGAKMRNCKDDG